MEIIGLIAAIAVLIIGAYRGMEAIPLTLLATFVVMLTNGLPIWTTLSTAYAPGFGSVIASYFFIFVSSAIYAVIMEKTGCASAIGYQFIDWFGTKHVMLICILFVGLLTYGGVSLFVVLFATMPVMFILFREAGLPRHLLMLVIAVGSGTITMTTLPGSPSLTNVIPSQFLGTPMTAAPVFSLIMAAIFFGGCMLYANIAEKIARKNGETWSYPKDYDPTMLEIDRSTLPGAATSFLPIIFLIAFIVGSSLFRDQLDLAYAKDATLLTTLAMTIATVLCIVLNMGKLKEIGGVSAVKEMFGEGAINGVRATFGLASVVAFGGVVSSTVAFQNIVAWVLALEMSPYLKGVSATVVISAITGSSSGGIRLTLQNISEYLLGSGANMEVMHRCMAISADALDSLPHSSGIFMMLSLLGLKHKEAYKHVWWTTCVVPIFVTILAVACAMIFWPV